MKKIFLLLFLLLHYNGIKAQGNYYFPASTPNATWDTISPASLGWCMNYKDSLDDFLTQSNSKACIILVNGKIAYEKYVGTFTKDSIWYWASAGKTITSLLTGIAQEEGYLNISDTSSKYLGVGWTNCTQAQEEKITIRHQLTMSSGIDDNVPNTDCQEPTCLGYAADAGTRWAYHNAVYLLLQKVIATATGTTYQNYTSTRLLAPTGMFGLWFDSVFYSRARDMARFGSLMLNKGIWNGDSIIHDQNYVNDAINTSQAINNSYGYLWWLNGKSSYMLPQSQFVFNGEIIPNAPSDAYCALGKNDQKIYVSPSRNMVVIRMGNSAGIPLYALSNYDNELWAAINQFACTTTGIESVNKPNTTIYPNPANDFIRIKNSSSNTAIIYNIQGMMRKVEVSAEGKIDIRSFSPGLYFIKQGEHISKFVITR